MDSKPIEVPYNGFRISGSAQPEAMGDNGWFAVGEVLLDKRDHSVLLVDRFLDRNLTTTMKSCVNGSASEWLKLVVDHVPPPAEYFLLPMKCWLGRRYSPACRA
jgi:hypothetical protein